MRSARAAVIVFVLLTIASVVILLSPASHPLKAPFCASHAWTDVDDLNRQEARRSEEVAQAVERTLREAPSDDPEKAIRKMSPCFAVAVVPNSSGRILRVARSGAFHPYFAALVFRGTGEWHGRPVNPAGDIEMHIDLAVASPAGVDVLFSVTRSERRPEGASWLELHRLTDDLRLVWRSAEYRPSVTHVFTSELVLTTSFGSAGSAAQQTLWRRQGDAFEPSARRTVPNLKLTYDVFLMALRRGDTAAALDLATNPRVVDDAAKVVDDIAPVSTDFYTEDAYWEALPEAFRGPLPAPRYEGSSASPRLVFVRRDGNWRVDGLLAGVRPPIAAVGDGGSAATARLIRPTGVAVDGAGNVYIADAGQHRVRRVTPTGVISTVAGTGRPGFAGDGGPATAAPLMVPFAVAVDRTGAVFIADRDNHRVRRVAADGTISTVAGPALSGSTGGRSPALVPELEPTGLAVGPDGSLYITDTFHNHVVRVSSDGSMSTYAGTGESGFAGDGGPAASAQLRSPSGLAVGSDGVLYIADRDNQRVRAVAADGTISTVAGSGLRGFSGDGGSARAAQLDQPLALAFDRDGALLIADGTNDRIRRVSRSGTIDSVVGTGRFGAEGDRGPARDASLNEIFGLAVARDGVLYLADTRNDRVRKVVPSGSISTFAGAGLVQSPEARATVLIPGLALQIDAHADTGGITEMMLLTDGRVLTSEVNGLGMTPKLIERRLGPAGVKAVLAKALGSGLFTNGPCCGSEVFPGEDTASCCGGGVNVLLQDGQSVYAANTLVWTTQPRFSPATKRLEELVHELLTPESWLPVGDWLDPATRPYKADRYRLMTNATWDDPSRPHPIVDYDQMIWPAGLEIRPSECRELSPAQATALLDAVKRAGDRSYLEPSDNPTVVLGWARFDGTFSFSVLGLSPKGTDWIWMGAPNCQ